MGLLDEDQGVTLDLVVAEDHEDFIMDRDAVEEQVEADDVFVRGAGPEHLRREGQRDHLAGRDGEDRVDGDVGDVAV